MAACSLGKCVRYGMVFNGEKSDNVMACQGGFLE
jgi:hypothetical protein